MPARKLTDQQLDSIVVMREAGLTYKAIADAIGCSESAVYWRCLCLAADPPKPRKLCSGIVGPATMMRNGFPLRRFTAEEDARLLALEAQGLNEHRIALELGRKRNSIRGRLMTLARRDARMEASA